MGFLARRRLIFKRGLINDFGKSFGLGLKARFIFCLARLTFCLGKIRDCWLGLLEFCGYLSRM